jgi:hypothetical protein
MFRSLPRFEPRASANLKEITSLRPLDQQECDNVYSFDNKNFTENQVLYIRRSLPN